MPDVPLPTVGQPPWHGDSNAAITAGVALTPHPTHYTINTAKPNIPHAGWSRRPEGGGGMLRPASVRAPVTRRQPYVF